MKMTDMTLAEALAVWMRGGIENNRLVAAACKIIDKSIAKIIKRFEQAEKE